MKEPINISIGPCCPTLISQLHGIIPVLTLQSLDCDCNALIRCYVRGFITDSNFERGKKRLMQHIEQAIKARKEAE